MSETSFFGTRRHISTNLAPDSVLLLLERHLATPKVRRFLTTDHPAVSLDTVQPKLYASLVSCHLNPVMPPFRCDIVPTSSGGSEITLQPEHLTRTLYLINAAFLVFLAFLILDGIHNISNVLVQLVLIIVGVNLTIGCTLFIYRLYLGRVARKVQEMIDTADRS